MANTVSLVGLRLLSSFFSPVCPKRIHQTCQLKQGSHLQSSSERSGRITRASSKQARKDFTSTSNSAEFLQKASSIEMNLDDGSLTHFDT
jgi:hypothetical protein